MDNKIQFDFEAKYFKIEDISVDPQHQAEFQNDYQLVYAQIEATFEREQYEMLRGGAAEEISNKGKNLMIFNDKSGSMSGTPFRVLTEACIEIAD